jgi:hypothetical protein
MTTTPNFSSLRGTDSQKLETLGFMKSGTANLITRLERQGSVTGLHKALDKYDAICIEIEKYTN